MKNFCGVCIPGSTKWTSVRIFWGNRFLDNFTTINPFPELQVPSSDDESVIALKRDVKISPFEPTKTYNSGMKTMESLIEDSNYDFESAFKAAGKVTEETLCIDPNEIKNPDKYIDNATKSRVKEIRTSGKKIVKKRKGIIANAVSQFVIVKIEMTTAIYSVADLPDITTWAFLQPPTIGSNKHRMSVNNGYVVDDAQKAGWFKAQISANTAQEQASGLWVAEMQVDRYEVNENAERKNDFTLIKESKPVWIKHDDKDPKTVLLKFEVVVRNDCTLTDLHERKEVLRGDPKLKQNMVTAECGSYLKVWVRNTAHTWSKDPVDEFSEALREAMASEDESYDTNNPQKFKNHTWRRSPLLSGDPSKDLLYVGLYPSAVIQRLEAIDKMMLAQPSPGDKGVNYGVWLAITSLFSLLCYALHEASENSAINAHSKDHSKTQAVHIKEMGEKVRAMLNLFSVEEFAAALAVAGLPRKDKGLSGILDECKKDEAYKTTYAFTVYIYKQMLDFALIKGEEAKNEHHEKIAEENTKLREKQANYDVDNGIQNLQDLLKLKKVDKKKISEILGDFVKKGKVTPTKFHADLDLGSAGVNLKMPFPKGMPLPIPLLQWIIWSTEFLATAGMKLAVDAEYKQSAKTETEAEKEIVSLDISLDSDSKAAIKFSLQSAWAAYVDNAANGHEEKGKGEVLGDFAFGQMMQDLAKATEFNLFVGMTLNANTKIGPKFEYDMAKEKDAFSISLGNASGGVNMVAPAGAHLSIFKWDYDLASAKIVDVNKNEGTFFKELTFLNKRWTTPQIVRWGNGDLYEFVVLHNPLSNREYVIGDNIQLALPYLKVENAKTKASITFVDSDTYKTVELKTFGEKLVEQVTHYEKNDDGDDFTHRSLLEFKLKVLDADKLSFSFNKPKGGLTSDSASAFVKDLADGKDIELGALFELNNDKRMLDNGTGPVVLAPKIVKSDGFFDHGRKELIFKVKIDNFKDDKIWVRFKEENLISNDVLKYALLKGTLDESKDNSSESKASLSDHEEWNVFSLVKNGSDYLLSAPLNQFENLDLEFYEKELIIYPEIALAKGEEYVISKDVDIEPVNVSPSMMPA